MKYDPEIKLIIVSIIFTFLASLPLMLSSLENNFHNRLLVGLLAFFGFMLAQITFTLALISYFSISKIKQKKENTF